MHVVFLSRMNWANLFFLLCGRSVGWWLSESYLILSERNDIVIAGQHIEYVMAVQQTIRG